VKKPNGLSLSAAIQICYELREIMNHKHMQLCLDRLCIPLTVCWVPDKTKAVHGQIYNSNLFIYDSDEKEAWLTLQHEIAEYKLQSVTRPYRLLANALIETIEKSIYAQKEEFIEFLPKMSIVIQKAQDENRLVQKVGLKVLNPRKRLIENGGRHEK
jgi:hypothetical protein